MKRIKLFEEFLNERINTTHDFNCAMLYFDFPAMAFVSLEKKEVLDFSKPLSNVSLASSVMPDSLFSDENILLKKLILKFRIKPFDCNQYKHLRVTINNRV